MDRNQSMTASDHDLLTPFNQTTLFSKRATAVTDGSKKRNGWLNLELPRCPYLIERHSKKRNESDI